MNTPIRVALVGLGWAGRSIWLPRLDGHSAFTVVAGVDPAATARTKLTAGPATSLVASVADLDPGSIDLAVVATPNHMHAAVASDLLARGISVFVEKPVCLSSAEADQLAEAEATGGAVLLAGSAARYRADVRSMYDIAGSLGRLRHIEASWLRARGVPKAGGWFTRRDLSGGGALVDLGWHLLDAIAPLLGTADFAQLAGTTSDDFVSAGARGATWRNDGPVDDGWDADVEDTARGFLVTDDGVSVALRASWASHEARDATVITVEGAAGTATLRCTFGFSPNREEASTLTLTRDGDTKVVDVPAEPIGAEYDRQLAELPRSLADRAGGGRALEEARWAIGIIERLYGSARRPLTIAD